MALTAPHDLFREALRSAGWRVDQAIAVGSGPNPSRVKIQKARISRWLLVYAWKITSEGSGRKKAGRQDLDFRVQTTRSHENDLLAPPGHLPVGIGWFEDLGVFAGFAVWVKRTTGKSSSVHFSRLLLETAAKDGWAEEMRADGPTCAWKPDEVERYLSWLVALNQSRVLAIDPVEHHVTDDILDLRVDPRPDWRRFALRVGDCLVLRRSNMLLDRSLWRITEVSTDRQTTESGSNRPYLTLRCHRHGTVHDHSWLN